MRFFWTENVTLKRLMRPELDHSVLTHKQLLSKKYISIAYVNNNNN